MRSRYEAVEADFLRFYGVDLEALYRGELRPLKAARLASQLPPGSGIYRPPDHLDSQVFSMEAQLIRALINDGRAVKDRIPTIEEVQAATNKKLSRERLAAAALAYERARTDQQGV